MVYCWYYSQLPDSDSADERVRHPRVSHYSSDRDDASVSTYRRRRLRQASRVGCAQRFNSRQLLCQCSYEIKRAAVPALSFPMQRYQRIQTPSCSERGSAVAVVQCEPARSSLYPRPCHDSWWSVAAAADSRSIGLHWQMIS
jgi:hypothetical protein